MFLVENVTKNGQQQLGLMLSQTELGLNAGGVLVMGEPLMTS